jgi:hypothetical protein
LLLDEFPNAAAAYSLRLLSSSYTGNCIEVRRSSDDALQNIGFVNGVLDTASLLSFVGAGDGFVSIWYDQSGGDFNLLQTNNDRQPRIVNSGSLEFGLNSLPAIRNVIASNGFIGLPRESFNFLHQAQATISIVSNISSGTYILASTDAGAANTRIGIDILTNTGISVCNGSGVNFVIRHSGILLVGNKHIYIDYNNIESVASDRSSLLLNNVAQANNIETGNVNLSNSFANLMLTARRNGEAASIGTFQEIIIWDSRKSSDRNNIISNINAYYNIY